MLRFALILLASSSAALAAQDSFAPEALAADPLVILEQRCVSCHNPARRKSDLDLTERATALRGGTKGPAFVPGDADQSLVLAVIEHRRKPHMPLREPPLPADEVAALRAWITAGATYSRAVVVPRDAAARTTSGEVAVTEADRAFWSFRPLVATEVPQPARPERAHTDADRFWLARLDAAGIAPSHEADRRVLLRRLCFTLLGLPPDEQQVHAFVADDRPDAYERVVDALLASPHFGERQARHWLDVARYADSGGYEFDYERPHAYPYRDFVIEAMNADMPFDEFVRLQVAADELHPSEPQTWRATGFLCAGPTVGNQENEQTRYDEYDDVVSTLGAAFLGLTVGCARCHDHKFDPIPTRDYYRLVAALSTTQRDDRALLPAKELEVQTARTRARRAEQIVLRERREAVENAARTRLRQQRVRALTLDPQARALLLADADPDRLWHYTLAAPPSYWFTETFDDASWLVGPAPFGVARRDFEVATPWAGSALWIRRTFTWEGDPDDLAFGVFHDEDVAIWVNGALAARASGFVRDYVLLTPTAAAKAALRPGSNVLAVHCRHTEGGQGLDIVPLHRGAVTNGDVRAAVVSRRQRLEQTHADALRIERDDLDPVFTLAEREALTAIARAERNLPPRQATDLALVMTDRGAEPEPSYLLRRGDPADKQEELAPGFLQVLTPLAEQATFYAEPPANPNSTGRRTALARWLTGVDHGAGDLLARVIVNRLWQHHMGQGLVGTPNDFGLQGERPTHPELLDWLAQRLIDGGFRLKPIHRLIVTSAFYRQASHQSPLPNDADNRLWSQRVPVRLDAESLRDAVLHTTGSLNRKMFGPSVKPWMHKDAIATGSTNKWPLDVRDGPATWRRSLYVFMRRSVRFPLFEVFDAPDATASCGRRLPTTTPLQALALMNDVFVREQARIFATRVQERAGDDIDAQITHAFAMALKRPPQPDERTRVAAFLEQARHQHGGSSQRALVDLCQVALNLNEFVYVD